VHRQSPTYAIVTYPKGRHTLNSVYMRSTVYVFTTESSELPKSKTLEPEGPQHDKLTACVVGQQYSSATVVSLRNHFRHGKTWRALYKLYCYLLSFKNLDFPYGHIKEIS